MTTYADVSVSGEWQIVGDDLGDMSEEELRLMVIDDLCEDPYSLMIDVYLKIMNEAHCLVQEFQSNADFSDYLIV